MNLSPDFEKYTRELMGEKLYGILINGLANVAPTSIRLNPFKCPKGTRVAMESCRVPWSQYGYYLNHRPNFTFDPLLHAGAYYVQEASSMFIEHVLREIIRNYIPHPARTLDLCAAPGGKSIAARSVLPEDSLLYSNEPIYQRAHILWENMQKMGHPNVVVTKNYARDFSKAKMLFDIIIADVPCSGEGMFRKDPNAIQEWSIKNVEKCWRLQRDIITDIWPCLSPNGILIYSTCTFNAHENEENVTWIAEELGADFVEIDVQEEWNITGSLTDNHPVYRFLPGKTRGEGLFMAILKKRDQGNFGACRDGSAYSTANIPQGKKGNSQEKTLLRPYNPTSSGSQMKKDIPPHSKALSIKEGNKDYPHIDIDYAQAINYLRKEAIVLPSDTPKGIVLLTYQHVPIGFAKNIGNRANNLYPQEWKIKSTHIPKHETILEFA